MAPTLLNLGSRRVIPVLLTSGAKRGYALYAAHRGTALGGAKAMVLSIIFKYIIYFVFYRFTCCGKVLHHF